MKTDDKVDSQVVAEDVSTPEVPSTETTQTLEPRVHIDEVVDTHPELSQLQKTAFKIFMGVKKWMRVDEWEQEIKKYLN